MTHDDKELLLQDLCARLPYGVICQVDDGAAGLNDGKLIEIDLSKELVRFEADYYWKAYIDDIKPYLRPMSSMTEEEEINLYKVTGFYYLSNNELRKDEWYSFKNSIKENKLFFPYPIWLDDLQKVFDWLNKNQFDYRDLIPKGLAIAVTKENNPYKE